MSAQQSGRQDGEMTYWGGKEPANGTLHTDIQNADGTKRDEHQKTKQSILRQAKELHGYFLK